MASEPTAAGADANNVELSLAISVLKRELGIDSLTIEELREKFGHAARPESPTLTGESVDEKYAAIALSNARVRPAKRDFVRSRTSLHRKAVLEIFAQPTRGFRERRLRRIPKPHLPACPREHDRPGPADQPGPDHGETVGHICLLKFRSR